MRPQHLRTPEELVMAAEARAHRPTSPKDRPRPALERLAAAWDDALAEEGPGAVWALGSRLLRDSWTTTPKITHIRNVEKLFKPIQSVEGR